MRRRSAWPPLSEPVVITCSIATIHLAARGEVVATSAEELNAAKAMAAQDVATSNIWLMLRQAAVHKESQTNKENQTKNAHPCRGGICRR